MPQAVESISVPVAIAPTGNINEPSRLPSSIRPPVALRQLGNLDARFWELYDQWRAAETAFEAWGPMPDECEVAEALCERSTELLDAMLGTGVRTACALSMKMEAVREGDLAQGNYELASGLTVIEVICADIERLAKLEMWGGEAFADMAGELVQ